MVLDVPTKLENTVCGTVPYEYFCCTISLGFRGSAGGPARLYLSPRTLISYHTYSYVMGYYTIAIWMHLEIAFLRRTPSCTIIPKVLEHHTYLSEYPPSESISHEHAQHNPSATPNFRHFVNFAPIRTFIYLFPNTRSRQEAPENRGRESVLYEHSGMQGYLIIYSSNSCFRVPHARYTSGVL